MSWQPPEDAVSRALLLIARGGTLEDAAGYLGRSPRIAWGFLSTLPEYAEALAARAVVARCHGTLRAYKGGCRCYECREAKAANERRYRERRQPPSHGTASGYLNHGCRCDACRDAHKEAQRSRTGTAGHGSARRASEGCQCAPCTSRRRRRHDATRRRNEASREGAGKSGQVWTGPELEIVATRTDLSTRDLAAMLGRTIASVSTKRSLVQHDPKWAHVAGASRGT